MSARDGHGRIELPPVEYRHEQGDPGVDDSYRLCSVRGPEGIIVGLAEQLG